MLHTHSLKFWLTLKLSGYVPHVAVYVCIQVVILFMAVTSSGSAELIAVSSLISYDIYREYINPRATGKQMLLCSRISVCIFAVCMGGECASPSPAPAPDPGPSLS